MLAEVGRERMTWMRTISSDSSQRMMSNSCTAALVIVIIEWKNTGAVALRCTQCSSSAGPIAPASRPFFMSS
ncbi:MAG: hypothetical protein U1E14_10365 [Geminicoccaceae bacterium]